MIIIIYSVCPIFTNPPDWRKALSNGVRNHLFKLKTSKISQGGDLPPPAPPPRSRSGLRPDRRGLKLWGKKMIPRRGGGEMIEMHNIYPWLYIEEMSREVIAPSAVFYDFNFYLNISFQIFWSNLLICAASLLVTISLTHSLN